MKIIFSTIYSTLLPARRFSEDFNFLVREVEPMGSSSGQNLVGSGTGCYERLSTLPSIKSHTSLWSSFLAKTVSHSPGPLQTVSKPQPSWARAHDPNRKKKKSGYRDRGLRVTKNEEIVEPGPETMCSPICKPSDTDMGNQTKVGQKTASM